MGEVEGTSEWAAAELEAEKALTRASAESAIEGASGRAAAEFETVEALNRAAAESGDGFGAVGPFYRESEPDGSRTEAAGGLVTLLLNLATVVAMSNLFFVSLSPMARDLIAVKQTMRFSKLLVSMIQLQMCFRRVSVVVVVLHLCLPFLVVLWVG